MQIRSLDFDGNHCEHSRPKEDRVMGLERRLDVPVYDLSLIRGLWEGRVKKYRQRQKKEKERIEQSALARIDQQWQYRIYCKSLKRDERTLLHQYLQRSTLTDLQPGSDGDEEDHKDQPQTESEPQKLLFRLDGDKWLCFPKELQWMTYLREWYVTQTRIQRLPDFLALFTRLTVMELPKNQIVELPPEIGKLTALKELNLSYNRLSKVPPELGECKSLERLELAGNRSLSELPFELSSLKRLVHLDISENLFLSIPVCVLRMTALQLLDLSNNRLKDLPQDMDRLENLLTLIVHKTSMTYLPQCLTNIQTLKMVIVSGDQLNCIPTRICSNPDIKFIRLYDSPTQQQQQRKQQEEALKEENRRRRWRGQPEEGVQPDSTEKEFLQAYISTLTDRDSVPYSTTKISISCLL